MKLKYILPLIFIGMFTFSCSSDDDNNSELNELGNLLKVKDLSNDVHTIELYTASGNFNTGYNAITFRVKDNATGKFIENAYGSWMPMMEMAGMSHSCPKSSIKKTTGKSTLYEGFIIYQMTNLDGSGWTLDLNYVVDGSSYSVSDTISVLQNDTKNVTSFTGDDNVRYVLALIEPQNPKIALNDITMGLFKMDTMMSFPVVENFSIELDPRMPDMGNHSSPNNVDLSYNSLDQLYHGKLALTMTGYWVLNLKLLDADAVILKGEDLSEEQLRSSLFLDLEF